MPLDYRDSPEAFSANVGELVKSGRSQAQAVAIAYRVRREGRKKKRKRE
jgi:hypothetical protein